jgi:hypothetical protein
VARPWARRSAPARDTPPSSSRPATRCPSKGPLPSPSPAAGRAPSCPSRPARPRRRHRPRPRRLTARRVSARTGEPWPKLVPASTSPRQSAGGCSEGTPGGVGRPNGRTTGVREADASARDRRPRRLP